MKKITHFFGLPLLILYGIIIVLFVIIIYGLTRGCFGDSIRVWDIIAELLILITGILNLKYVINGFNGLAKSSKLQKKVVYKKVMANKLLMRGLLNLILVICIFLVFAQAWSFLAICEPLAMPKLPY
jgi:hypothetical protein